MSTTETLRTLVDNLQLEIQQLQVENAKLKAHDVEDDVSEASGLKAEVEELRQRLHESQEQEVNSEQRVRDLEEEHEATKVKLSDLQGENKMISQEAVQLREQCSNYAIEIERLNGASELAIYRAVETERRKWEEREARWLSEYSRFNNRPDEAARSRSSIEDAGIPTNVTSVEVNGNAGITTVTTNPTSSLTAVPICTTVQPTSAEAASSTRRVPIIDVHMDASVNSRDVTNGLPVRLTSGVNTSATPPLSGVALPTGIRPNGIGSVTWVASTGQLTSANRLGVEQSASGAAVSPSLLHPVSIQASHSPTTNGVLHTAGLSAFATPFLPSCIPSVGTFPNVPFQPSPGVTGISGHGGWSTEGNVTSLQPVASPQQVGVQMPCLLGQQLPPISKFSGEDLEGDGETFLEWIEQFELVADMCGWNDQAKLVNLTTRLRGQAYSFYRTCTPKQRAEYKELKTKLTERFTPVRIQAVHSNLFHQRKQELSETVDNYAQDLRRLFYKAYPKATQGSEEAEDLGRSVLAYQFVSGLTPALRTEVAGVEGNFDQLLVKARFEEAKIRDLTPPFNPGRNQRSQIRCQPESTSQAGLMATSTSTRAAGGKSERQQTGKRCYSCNGTGHFQKNCPLKARSDPVEAPGKGRLTATGQQSTKGQPTTATLQGDALQKAKDKVAQLRRELQAAEREESIAKVTATTNTLQSSNTSKDPTLGPMLMTTVSLEGHPTQALIDTGSPISLVSIDFLLRALTATLGKEVAQADLAKALKARLEDSSLTVRNFGGDEVNVVGQATVTVSCGRHECEVTLLVQKGAQLELLLGTDVLGKLGFQVLQDGNDGKQVDLLSISTTQQEESAARSDAAKQATTTNTVHTVRVLKAARIPGRHCRTVKAYSTGLPSEEVMLFTCVQLDSEDHQMAEVVVTPCIVIPGADGMITIAVENHSCHPVILGEGQLLGTMEHVHILQNPIQVCAVSSSIPICSSEDRASRVLKQLDIDTSLEEAQKKELYSMVEEFSDVFALDSSELGRTNLVQHIIDTGDHLPIKQLPHRTPFALRQRTEELINKMLDEGVIRNSNSPWASPVVLVAKKDGSTRFCVDYRRLNSVTKMDTFPLPRVDDSLDLLANTAYFSTLDLASGYWQVGMDADSQPKTAFCSHSGLYEFTVMPFGLSNAPATFQRLMETVLSGLARNKCFVYLDDILVVGKTFEEHHCNLREVLKRLRQAGLCLKPSKCHLAQREVAYLGYIVSNKGITADPSKVRAVEEFPVPSTVKELRSFLGLASYYRRFIPGFSKMATPLFALTHKDAVFEWDARCQETFDHLKSLLTNAPLLVFPDFTKSFVLETDASGDGLGAVLAQEQEDGLIAPIAFASRTLQKHERNYGVTELEALGVVWAVKHFRPYLYGHTCHVYTDHEALKSLLNTPHPSGKLARWGLAIQELDLHIHYRPGRSNQAADALSRLPLPSVLSHVMMRSNTPGVPAQDGEEAICQVTAVISPGQSLAERQEEDPELRAIRHYLLDAELPADEKKAREIVLGKGQFEIVDGVLYHIELDKTLRIVLPLADRRKIFELTHGGLFGGHLRSAKLHGQLAKHYWWPGMRGDIIKWSRACRICASRQVGQQFHTPLTPIPVSGPFDRMGIDVIKFPTSSRGNKYAVVMMDYLTKWPEVFATKDQTSLTIARLLVEHIVPRHGVPKELLSDRGAAFLSKLMDEVYSLLGIQKVNTTAYHPQTDGLVERFNRTLTDMLAKKVKKNGKDWDIQLPYVLFAYRATPQESTGESPFYLVYGRDPSLPTNEMLSHPDGRFRLDLDDYRMEITARMSDAWQTAQAHIRKAQSRQKRSYDKRKKAVHPEISEGDRVMLYAPAEKRGKAYKFARPFQGPYRVLKVLPNGVELVLVSKPKARSIRVSLDRVRRCPVEMEDTAETSDHLDEPNAEEEVEGTASDEVSDELEPGDENSQPLLRRSKRLGRHHEDMTLQDGEM